ncbi:PREDICTED: mitogen-activated protein kinase kinase kinase 7-like isoform X2 [Drosophila arizonae]|uniref:Mitogen-activated protein kinase kinase kinase 7-like isoform X2 n=1 Tax=Drosophila arizonae TaxID=7263 RepID=A0ABM1NWS1_DROAR|nr:PREDICTED: mitogen-activated protein kinase kinase kinase 7-like isoform X2 [Drosophila arizonae]
MAAIINHKYIQGKKELLGTGSYGEVYTAELKVAIKQLRFSEAEINKSFEAEATNLLRAQHPNIIRLYGISGKHTLVMEYADNNPLDKYIHNKDSKITNSHRQNLMLQCAEGVAYLHSLTPLILHRDLKPANILLTNNYCTLKICDFGTAREIGTEMTAEKGTPAYRAPEINQTMKYTEKCDVYSFALILWEVMSGKKPFADQIEELIAIPYQTSVKNLRPNLDDVKLCENTEIMKDLIEQGWDKKPYMRPSMKMFALLLSLDHSSMKYLLKPSSEDYKDATKSY